MRFKNFQFKHFHLNYLKVSNIYCNIIKVNTKGLYHPLGHKLLWGRMVRNGIVWCQGFMFTPSWLHAHAFCAKLPWGFLNTDKGRWCSCLSKLATTKKAFLVACGYLPMDLFAYSRIHLNPGVLEWNGVEKHLPVHPKDSIIAI
jgi:hypothetical protein